MDSPNFASSLKNRSQKSENFWVAPSSFHQSSSSANRTTPFDKVNQIAYIYVYLILEKNLKGLAHIIKKL
jgi:hypothetical protein